MTAGDPTDPSTEPAEPPTATTGPTGDDDEVSRRTDRAYHLARTIARFRATISPEGAARLADILTIDTNPPTDTL
ncbi:hypothetical protein [Parafrankia sp. BMG5.11]|uniref:hypothetical protein n=1 Tax=Parafrankia sp. BMG5.11 TaxID=222540 RepID=UPI00103F7193|nr:hypothetical protein [Parafrankia sp. BMG5.11]TCJ35906.1 hypothetical protein E0504_25375 [Parafrankia sp. BMG5.11]